MEKILEIKGITKLYPGVRALDQISIQFKQGEVHALLGENGAGKSTLIKVLSGAIEPTAGRILYDGMEYTKLTPAVSKRLGIRVIYQEFNLIPTLTIAENIYLNRMDTKKLMINRKTMTEQAACVLAELGIELDPSDKVGGLSIAHQQLVEIAKAFSDDARILIMDEPTAPLTDTEVQLLFQLVRSMKERGVTIIYISHRLEELFEIADRVTVLRDGAYVDTREIGQTNTEELIRLMVGRPLTDQYPKREPKFGEILLEARGIYARDLVKNASFYVRAGEVLGIAGLVGAGRTELIRAVYGADKKQAGDLYIGNEKVSLSSPAEAIKRGIALIPEDRKAQGALLDMNIVENIALSSAKRFSFLSILNKRKLVELVKEYVQKLKIKTPDIYQTLQNLSGGNQQKVIIGKCLASQAKIYLFDEPTRGIDVGAKYEIYLLINELASQGNAVVIISSELPEVLGMSDRILVMHEGEIAGELSREEATQEAVMSLASGDRNLNKKVVMG